VTARAAATFARSGRGAPHNAPVSVGIIDVGSNTARLLIAARGRHACVAAIREERAHVGLGEEIERCGHIGARKLAEAAEHCRAYASIARRLGVSEVDVVVTAPGRQAANGGALVDALAAATEAPVRVLSSEEEGRLAYLGAVAGSGTLPRTVAVCDVGGGSTEIVVGTRGPGSEWVRSVDIGSLRLTNRLLGDDPPGKAAVRAARSAAREALAGLEPPPARAALATGGSARALRKLVGRTLGAEQLERALRETARRPAEKLARRLDLDPHRARTLAAGAVILLEVQRCLGGPPFRVARGGLREGAALELLAAAVAA
jgi:exopolyphosphatase/guanosine-5'-triphosphate,3'-diphosphate pyrophosphatase